MSKNSRQIFLIFLAYYGMTCVSNAYFLFGPYYESLGATPQRAGLFLSAFYMVTLFCRLPLSVVNIVHAARVSVLLAFFLLRNLPFPPFSLLSP